MRKLIVVLCVFVLMCSFTSCNEEHSNHISNDSSPNYPQYDPECIIISNAELYADYAVLPLCDTIASLGFDLTWLDTNTATFVCNDGQYEISILKKTLTKVGAEENYLICAPGNNHFVCEVKNGTLMVDDNTVKCLFQTFLDYPVRILIDHNDGVVILVKE